MTIIINQKLVIVKCLYFSIFSIVGSLFIYLSPFLSDWGITASEMAIINLVTNILAFFLRPFCGYIADKYKKYKEIFMVLTIVCTVTFLLELASPKHPKPTVYSLNKQYSINISSYYKLITVYTSQSERTTCWPSNLYNCIIKGLITLKMSALEQVLTEMNYSSAQYSYLENNVSLNTRPELFICENISHNCNNSKIFEVLVDNVGMTGSTTFWILGILKIIGCTCFSPLCSLIDAVTFINLGSNNGDKFGFTRMFGTIGMLIFSLLMAAILKGVSLSYFESGQWIFNMQRFSQFSTCFIMGGVIFGVMFISSIFLSIDYSKEKAIVVKDQSFKSKFLELTALNVLFHNAEHCVCVVFAVLGGFFYIIFIEYFFLIIFQRYSSLPKYFPGLVLFITTLSEAVAFGTTSKLLKYKGYEFWVSLSFFTWGLRWFSYIFINNFWFLLLVELLHGPSFGLMLACMMTHVSEKGTGLNQGRIQGMFTAIYFNIGGALGGFVGGVILDNFGFFGLFKFMSAVGFCCSLYCPLQIYVIRRISKSPKSKHVIIHLNQDDSNKTALLFEDS